jgi:hypothetical protein
MEFFNRIGRERQFATSKSWRSGVRHRTMREGTGRFTSRLHITANQTSASAHLVARDDRYVADTCLTASPDDRP